MELMCFSVTWLHFFIRLLLHLVIKRVFGSEHIKILSETVGFITVNIKHISECNGSVCIVCAMC